MLFPLHSTQIAMLCEPLSTKMSDIRLTGNAGHKKLRGKILDFFGKN